MLSAERIALLKHGAPPRNALEAALRNAWGGGGTSYEKTVGPAPIISISDAKPKPAKSLIVGMEPIQDLHGYDSPWPAGGGKNLFNPSIATAGYLNDSGVAQPQSTTYYEYYSDYIPINGNTVSIGYFGYASEDSVWLAVAWYDSDKNFLSRSNTSTNPNTRSVPENASYAIAMMRTYNHGLDKCYFAYGNDLTFAPYSNECPITGRTGVTVDHSGADTSDPQTYPVVFPDSVGTVYGCTVDPVSGLLTVTHGIRTLDGTGSWSLGAYGNFRLSVSGMAHIDADVSGLYCTALKPIAYSNRGLVAVPCVMGADSNNIEIRNLSALGITTVDELKAWLAGNPVGIVYPLAEPQTYQLTPTQIQMLKGANVLWSDADDLTLTYIGTTPANLLGGMLGGGLGGAQEPTEETSEEPTEGEDE